MNKVVMIVIALFAGYVMFDQYKKIKPPVESLPPVVETQNSDITNVVNTINVRNSDIKSISSTNTSITLLSKNHKVKVNVVLAYEKNNKFRLVSKNKEIDIGSNDTVFWFWVKGINPNALHYAKHEDFYKTRLRTPLNPSWIMECLSVDSIDSKAFISTDILGKYVRSIELRKNASGQSIFKATLFNPENNTIYGHYVYSKEGNLLVSAEIKQYYYMGNKVFPAQIDIKWFEESMQMIIDIKEPQINTKINENLWTLPDAKNKLDMSKD